ncbi:MAG: type II 3-dehydroquinate dehydratase [Clostridia bacterium]|nr:type II 3-dehydroquinate dehydratase [Clostridia bacterium]MBR2943868.1 type II 3-dehydroquinate dehydratase [Clostridia bacterium]
MKILILNGPNINMLGIREPHIYGSQSYFDLENLVKDYAKEKGIELKLFQSNHEGALVDEIQNAYFQKFDGIVFNPAAYTHTSIALLDALKATKIPCVEVHISEPDSREEFRHISYIRSACIGTVTGKGLKGYTEAMELLINYLSK